MAFNYATETSSVMCNYRWNELDECLGPIVKWIYVITQFANCPKIMIIMILEAK